VKLSVVRRAEMFATPFAAHTVPLDTIMLQPGATTCTNSSCTTCAATFVE
jgi:hypothetical protein